MGSIRLAARAVLAAGIAGAADRVTVTGETIDTRCYVSDVMMGGADAGVGGAHHTCAMWCAAGGMPVGLPADDGAVCMVLKLGEEANAAGGGGFLKVASHRLTAEGDLHVRDGITCILVARVIEDDGITVKNHED